MTNKLRRTNTFIIILSLLIAFFCDVKSINWSLVYGGYIKEGIMGILYPVLIILIFFVSLIVSRLRFQLNYVCFFMVLYLCLFYYLTKELVGPPSISLPFFLSFVVASLLIPSIAKIDAKCFLLGLMFYPFFAIFNLEDIFVLTVDSETAVSMDASYGFLVPIIGTIMYIVSYFKQDGIRTKMFVLVCLMINSVFFTKLFIYGSRGPLLCLILLPIFLYVVRKKKNQNGVIIKKGIFSFILIVLFFVIIGYRYLLQIVANAFNHFGIKSYAIEKVIELIEYDNFSNGRSMINELAWLGFLDHPFLGNGLDRFDANTGLLYPHNFVLQILYDGGIVFFLFFLIPVIHGLFQTYKKCSKDEYVIVSTFLFSTIPGALVSNNMYLNSLLWLFFGIVISNRFIYTNTVRN